MDLAAVLTDMGSNISFLHEMPMHSAEVLRNVRLRRDVHLLRHEARSAYSMVWWKHDEQHDEQHEQHEQYNPRSIMLPRLRFSIRGRIMVQSQSRHM